MALLEKLSGSCQREKINAWPGSPGDWDPPPQPLPLPSLPISFTLLPLIIHTQLIMVCPVQTKDTLIEITLNVRHKFIWFILTGSLLVFSYSDERQQIALTSLLIIHSFMCLGWYDAAWMTGCHFKLTVPVRTGLFKCLEASTQIWNVLFSILP